MNPTARRDDVVFTEVEDQVVAYDTRAHVTHCLNPVAALVWRLADGSRSDADLAGEVAALHGAEAAPALVGLALERLKDAGLLQAQVGSPLRSRREMMRMIGLASVASAAALVTTVAVPHAAAAQSCLPNGAPCAFIVACCPGCICIGGICDGSCA